MSSDKVILPGATLGVMGSGQLGRMFAIAARKMGYRVQTFSPEYDTPTGQVADREVTADYGNEEAVRAFAKEVSVLTFEFENIPAQTIDWAADHCPVRPGRNVLHICQHRLREKQFLDGAHLPVAPFRKVEDAEQLATALTDFSGCGILKTAAFGYDGKGQRKIKCGEDPVEAWKQFSSGGECVAVLEEIIPFEVEISVLVARGVDGVITTWPVCENEHVNHILDVTYCPGRISESIARQARELAENVATALNLVGVLAVEMFLLPDGKLIINELAPRPHNSGHFSFDASVTSQFEQQVRAVCGLPLGSTRSLAPAAMVNLLGDVWANGEPNWSAAAALPDVKLHLYGKATPKPGRKMGHLTAFGSDADDAAEKVRAARRALQS